MIRSILFSTACLAASVGFASAAALSLDGVDDHATFVGTGIPEGNSSFTIGAWINPTSPTGGGSGGQVTFWGTEGPANTANGFRMAGPTGMNHYFWGNDHVETTGDLIGDTGGPNGDGWHHVAYSYDSGANSGTWYHNGAMIGTTILRNAGVPAVASGNYLIGKRPTGELFHGLIDEISIWSVALGDADIAGGWNAPIDASSPAIAPFLVAYWDFENGFADVAGGDNTAAPELGAFIDNTANAPLTGAPPADSDNDDLPDNWELMWDDITLLTQLNDLPAGSGPGAETGDFDGDGLSDTDELGNNADPTNTDTDGDGIDDRAEVVDHGTLPNNTDTDGDGLEDGDELIGTGGFTSDPTDPDTDGDLINDFDEIQAGTNPNDPDDPGTQPFGLADLQGYWTFDDPANLGADSSPNVNNLLSSGTPTAFGGGKFGGAVELEGPGPNDVFTQDVDFPTGVPTGGDSYAVSLWLNPKTGIPDNGGFVGWGNYGANGGSDTNAHRINTATGFNHYWWSNDLGGTNPGSFDWLAGDPPEGWHHWVGQYDALTQNHEVWIDGQLAASRVGGPPNVGALNFTIGKTVNDEYFAGQLDDVAIFSVPLEPAQITSLWNDGDGIPVSSLISGLTSVLEITKVSYTPPPAGDGFGEISITWISKSGKNYAVYWNNDLITKGQDLNDFEISDGESTTRTYPLPNPIPDAEHDRFFLWVEEL